MYVLNNKYAQLSGGQEGQATLILESGAAQEALPPTDPEFITQEEMIEQVDSMLEEEFPLPYVLVLIGYSFILLIDKVLIDSHDTPEHDCHRELAREAQKAGLEAASGL